MFDVPKDENSFMLSGEQHTPGLRPQRGFSEIPGASVYPADKRERNRTEEKAIMTLQCNVLCVFHCPEKASFACNLY